MSASGTIPAAAIPATAQVPFQKERPDVQRMVI
jgi:hypothetical protein